MTRSKAKGKSKSVVKSAPKKKAARRDEVLPDTIKDQLSRHMVDLTPRIRTWIVEGAEEESKLKAAKLALEMMEFVQPKLTRVVMSEEESKALARGVGAELRRQIASRLLADVPTSDAE